MITACIALVHRHLKVCGCKNINHQYSLASRAQEKEYSPHYKSMCTVEIDWGWWNYQHTFHQHKTLNQFHYR